MNEESYMHRNMDLHIKHVMKKKQDRLDKAGARSSRQSSNTRSREREMSSSGESISSEGGDPDEREMVDWVKHTNNRRLKFARASSVPTFDDPRIQQVVNEIQTGGKNDD